MAAIASWFRFDVRSRWRPLLGLALLIAFAGGTVLTATAGARRGSSAVDRLVARTLPATVVVLPNTAGFDWDAVRAMPEVEALTEFVVTEYDIENLPREQQGTAAGFPPADDEVMRTIERPVLLSGRLFDPERADEVVVSARFRSRHGIGVGDTLRLRLFAPGQVDTYSGGDAVAGPEGPAIDATIVGIVRSPWFSDEAGNEAGFIVPSPGLYAHYAPNLVGTESGVFINALARLEGGEAAIPQFKARLAQVTGRTDIEVWNMGDGVRHAKDVTGFEARSLLAFAMAAAVAAVFLVGQSVARYAASMVVDLAALRAMGFTPSQSRAAATIGPGLAALSGVVLGLGCALVASRWFPIGSASAYEPAPGFAVDAVVFAIGLVVVPFLVAVASLTAASLALRQSVGSRQARASTIAGVAERVGAPLPVAIGARFALEAGRGRQAVPVRPALLGAVIGVLGFVGAFTFSRGVNDAASNLERFGYTYDLSTYLGFNDADFGPSEDMLSALSQDPDVMAVNDTKTAVAETGRGNIDAFTFDPVGQPVGVVVTEGRMPTAVDEIAVGPRTAEALGVGVDDEIDLTGTDGSVRASVTGLAFVPAGPHNDYATGAWVTPETYDSLFSGFKFHFGLVAVREGADADVAAARIADERGIELEGVELPVELAELRQVRRLPLFLAAFLALLAVGAVGHALATAVRRRRHDLAVLRAVGVTRWQCRVVVLTQATILAVVGVAAGVPLGIALGRTLWRYVADSTPVHYLPPSAWLALILVTPLALGIANLLAAWPSQRAAATNVAHVLRAE